MIVVALALSLLSSSPSASTLAAVAVFAANADRTWPVDDREPAVTAEALRLLEVAGKSLADDWGVNAGDVRKSITAFASARAALEKQARGEEDRPRYAREAIIKGAAMIAELAGAASLDDSTTRQKLSDLKKAAEDLDRKKQVREQGAVLEKYFKQAAALMRELVEAPEPGGKD